MDDLRHLFPFLIPIVGIVMGIAIGMLAIWLDYQKKMHVFELLHKERLLATERGMEVPPLPPEFFTNGRLRDSDAKLDSLRRGLLLLLLGLGLGSALFINHGPQMASWALLPIGLGVAYLIFFKISPSSGSEADKLKAGVDRSAGGR